MDLSTRRHILSFALVSLCYAPRLKFIRSLYRGSDPYPLCIRLLGVFSIDSRLRVRGISFCSRGREAVFDETEESSEFDVYVSVNSHCCKEDGDAPSVGEPVAETQMLGLDPAPVTAHRAVDMETEPDKTCKLIQHYGQSFSSYDPTGDCAGDPRYKADNCSHQPRRVVKNLLSLNR